jgi:uncharacterized protein (DUF2062 family)
MRFTRSHQSGKESQMKYKRRFNWMPMNRLKGKVKKEWQDIVQSEASADGVARAFAVGTFVGLVPIPGLDIVLTILVLRLFKQVERSPLFAAMAVWNNLVAAPFYATGYKVGDACLKLAPTAIAEKASHPTFAWLFPFAVGNFIIALVMAIASYFAVRQGLNRYKSTVSTNSD